MTRSRRRLLWLAAVTAVLLVVMPLPIPADTRWEQVIEDFAHVPAFAVVTLLVAAQLELRRPRATLTPGRALAVLLASATIGGLTELVQMPGPRDASLGDLGRDVAGALVAMGGLALSSGAAVRRNLRVPLVVAGVAALVAVTAPVAWCAAAYANRAAAFPALARFESPLDLYFISGGTFERTGTRSLRVRLVEGPYPGVALAEPSPDWRGYGVLTVRVANPGKEPLPLTVRVHDRQHQNRYDDRYNGEFMLPPHRTTELEIPLDDISAAPRGRRLDLAHVAGIVLFSDASALGRELVIERIALEPLS